MNIRQAMIEVIREHVRSMPLADLTRYANRLPAQVTPGAASFIKKSTLGPWFQAQIVMHDISVAYELHQLIKERSLAVDKNKEAQTSGDNRNVKS